MKEQRDEEEREEHRTFIQLLNYEDIDEDTYRKHRRVILNIISRQEYDWKTAILIDYYFNKFKLTEEGDITEIIRAIALNDNMKFKQRMGLITDIKKVSPIPITDYNERLFNGLNDGTIITY